jgi:hypothetical protein
MGRLRGLPPLAPARTFSSTCCPVALNAAGGETDELTHPYSAVGKGLDDGDLARRPGRAHVRRWGSGRRDEETLDVVGSKRKDVT